MNYVMVGLNHHLAPVAIRERLAFDGEAMRAGLRELKSTASVSEAAILSTCNRVEIYAVTDQPEQTGQLLTARLVSSGTAAETAAPYLTTLCGKEAVAHLFSVAASLDSMVVGENQITGQVKDAYQAALETGATGAYLNRLFMRALYVSKRVKAETGIGQGSVSVGSSAGRLARRIFGNLTDKTIVLVGAGEIGELVVRHLASDGAGQIIMLNRTFERAQALACEGLGEARPLEELPKWLLEADVLITSVTGVLNEFDPAILEGVMQARSHAPLFLIDLGVPRNIPPAAGDLPDVYLYNVDDLQTLAIEGRKHRDDKMLLAKNIIDEEVALFYEFDREPRDAIAGLGRKFELLRRQELERTLGRWPGLDAEAIEAMDRLSQSLVAKILHDPILSLKANREWHEPGHLSMFRKIFRLDEEE